MNERVALRLLKRVWKNVVGRAKVGCWHHIYKGNGGFEEKDGEE